LFGYTQIGSPLTFKGTNATFEQILDGTSGIGALQYLDKTNYLSVLGTGLVTVTLSAPATQVSFYWGSIDKHNTITFSDGQSFTGNDITGKSPDGCQQMIDCNGVVTFKESNGGTFTSFTMSSSQKSFETDNFGVVLAPPVPEPSTCTMMILGFFGVGFKARKNRGAVAGCWAVKTPTFWVLSPSVRSACATVVASAALAQIAANPATKRATEFQLADLNAIKFPLQILYDCQSINRLRGLPAVPGRTSARRADPPNGNRVALDVKPRRRGRASPPGAGT
jgi:PEP-CTERM motif